MATAAIARPTHPALAFATPAPFPKSAIYTAVRPTLSTAPSTSSIKRTSTTAPSTPVIGKITPLTPHVNYALLRAHHASALKYVIARLRWDQANNGYTPGESAWREHNGMIQRLEDELKHVVAAQKGLDQFPRFCFAPIAPLDVKPYGPPSKEQFEKAEANAKKEEENLDRELDKQFPFIRQLFIGPMTRQQARNDRLLRKLLLEGDFDDLTQLLPSENRRLAMGGGERKQEKRRPYQEVRLEREKEKIKALQQEREKLAPAPDQDADGKKLSAARIGPLTKQEHIASLPMFGPKTRGETLLPIQREQRHLVLNFLRKPWPQYDEEAAVLLERLGRLAVRRLSADTKPKEDKQRAEAGSGEIAKMEKQAEGGKVVKETMENKKDEKTETGRVGTKQ